MPSSPFLSLGMLLECPKFGHFSASRSYKKKASYKKVYAFELFYEDFVELSKPERAPFVMQTNKQMQMLRASESRSFLIRVIQRVATFKKSNHKHCV